MRKINSNSFTGNLSPDDVWKFLSVVFKVKPHRSVESVNVNVRTERKQKSYGDITLFSKEKNRTFYFYSFRSSIENQKELNDCVNLLQKGL